jgi:hypothetical protein
MPDPVLSQRRLNRALLARQLLLERSPLGLTDALEAVGRSADAVRAGRVRRPVEQASGTSAGTR